MAVTKQLDTAAAAAATSKVTAKVSKPKDRSAKASQQTSQQSLHSRVNSYFPVENNTNTYIANINLNRDRFDNVLTSLGGLPSSKNITP